MHPKSMFSRKRSFEVMLQQQMTYKLLQSWTRGSTFQTAITAEPTITETTTVSMKLQKI